MKLPTKSLERKLFKSGYGIIYAVDEVGMGCLAGPVVVCAVEFKKKFFNRKHKKLHRLRDSKLLSVKQREEYAENLVQIPGFEFQICYSYPKTIDKVNIYNAARQAMKRAITRLAISSNEKPKAYSLKPKAIVLIDGPHKIPKLELDQIPIVKGDRKVFAIACASIIAKVYRDKMMTRYAKKYSGYGFEKHKGYGTKYHQAQLISLGQCEIHRKSFRLKY